MEWKICSIFHHISMLHWHRSTSTFEFIGSEEVCQRKIYMCLQGEILFKWLISGCCENKYLYMYWYIAKLQHVDPDIRQTDRQTNETGLHGLLGCLIIHMLWSLLGSARLCPVPASFGRSATQSLPCYSCHNSRSAAE